MCIDMLLLFRVIFLTLLFSLLSFSYAGSDLSYRMPRYSFSCDKACQANLQNTLNDFPSI